MILIDADKVSTINALHAKLIRATSLLARLRDAQAATAGYLGANVAIKVTGRTDPAIVVENYASPHVKKSDHADLEEALYEATSRVNGIITDIVNRLVETGEFTKSGITPKDLLKDYKPFLRYSNITELEAHNYAA